MSNSLDPDQAQHFVGPDLGSNCLDTYPTPNHYAYKISLDRKYNLKQLLYPDIYSGQILTLEFSQP